MVLLELMLVDRWMQVQQKKKKKKKKFKMSSATLFEPCHEKTSLVCLFVLRFYGPVNPIGSCRARSVYLTTRLLGRLSPLSG